MAGRPVLAIKWIKEGGKDKFILSIHRQGGGAGIQAFVVDRDGLIDYVVFPSDQWMRLPIERFLKETSENAQETVGLCRGTLHDPGSG